MIIINELGQLHKMERACVIALGTFDGLHLGHQDVILAAKAQAESTGALLTVFTFSNHPLQLIRPELVPVALLTKEKKYELLTKLGVEVLVDLPFNWELANLSPKQFIDKLKILGIQGIVVGENFTYGCKGAGNCALLAEAAKQHNFNLDVRPLVTNPLIDKPVSSTIIRAMLKEGHVEQATALLGRAYSLKGTVAMGNQRGRLLGFPTANIEFSGAPTAVPPEGVYAVRVTLANGKTYGGMANIGNNPTFGDVLKPRLEVNIFDFTGDLYGQTITVEFISRIREQQKFTGLEALTQQLNADKYKALELLKTLQNPCI